MPLVHFSYAGHARLGKLFGDHIVNLAAAAPQLPDTVAGFLAAGDEALDVFHAIDDERGRQSRSPMCGYCRRSRSRRNISASA